MFRTRTPKVDARRLTFLKVAQSMAQASLYTAYFTNPRYHNV